MKKHIANFHTHHMLKSLSISFIIVLFLISCKDDDRVPTNAAAYYPLEIGQYQIYDVSQVVYSVDIPDSTTTTWQERDVVDRIGEQNSNSTTYIVARYQRSSSNDTWKKVKEYSVEKSPDQIVRTIDNNAEVSLIFPVRDGFTWNGNIYNNKDPQDFKYVSTNESIVIDSQKFSNSVVVRERYDTSIIDNYVFVKAYAPGVGLIQDENTSFEYCQTDACIGEYTVESGSHTTKKINSYGMLQ